MTKVLAMSAARASAPSFRVRVLLPQEGLRQHGVVVDPIALLPDHSGLPQARLTRLTDLLRARRRFGNAVEISTAPVAMICRQADVLPVLDLEKRGMRGRRVVYDVDDAIWFDGSTAGGHPLAFVKGSRRKARWLAERADHVIAGNEILAEWLGRYAREVSVVPSLVDTDMAPQRTTSTGDEVVIGWIGSRTTAPYLARLQRPLEIAAKAAKTPIRLVTVGGLAPPAKGIRSVQQPWSPGTEAVALSTMDIGVMPLPDNRWTRGKCAYKAIQYMASGVPVLADDVGVTRNVVGEGGLVLRHEDEWTEALIELLRSLQMRQTLGAAGRTRAQEHFSVRAWAPRIARVLRGD